MIPTVFGVIVITFILFNMVGGSPGVMVMGRHANPKSLEEFDEERGYNKPLIIGLWSKTRAMDDARFTLFPGPWRAVEGIEHNEAGHIVLPPDASYALPLHFNLLRDTGYRLEMVYRLSGEGRATVQWGDEGAFELPASDTWRTVRVPFYSGDQPSALNPRWIVDGAPLEIQSVQLRRRAAHIFDSQLFHFFKQIAKLDFGTSSSSQEPVIKLIKAGIVPSLMLTIPIFIIGLVVAISLSLVCAFFRDSWLDRSFVVISVALMSINYIVWIVVGQYVLSFRMGLFPAWGFESAAYLTLPITIGVISGLGVDLRFYRTVMLDEMYKEYVRTAFAKGVSKPGVLFRHVLKNAMITILTNVVIAIPFLYTGSLLLEGFFGIPGLGYLGINAINSSDVDVIRAIVLIGSVIFVFANLLTDICYALVDPRVKLK